MSHNFDRADVIRDELRDLHSVEVRLSLSYPYLTPYPLSTPAHWLDSVCCPLHGIAQLMPHYSALQQSVSSASVRVDAQVHDTDRTWHVSWTTTDKKRKHSEVEGTLGLARVWLS